MKTKRRSGRRHKFEFKDYAVLYLEYSRVNKAPATFKRHDRNNMRSLEKAFGEKKLREITPLMIEGYKAKRLTRVSPATVNSPPPT